MLCRLKPVINSSVFLSATLEAEESRRWGEHRLSKWKNTEERATLGKEFKLLGPTKASHGHTTCGSLTRREQKWCRKNNVTTSRTGKLPPEPERRDLSVHEASQGEGLVLSLHPRPAPFHLEQVKPHRGCA